MFLFTVAIPHKGEKQTQSSAFSLVHVPLLALLLLALPPVGRAGQLPQEPQENQKEPLGSLMTFGKVYVNEFPAPAETTIFSGDRVRTEESGLATFNMGGKGSLKLAPHTEVIFSGKYEYTAELGAGSVVLNSVPGNNTFTLRIGSDVVVPSYKERTALAEIDRPSPDGSFVVKCSDGALGVLALHGTQGRFLQAGESLDVSPAGTWAAIEKQDATRKSFSGFKARTIGGGRRYPPWEYLAVAGGAAGVAMALDMSHGGGKQSVSPSAP